MKGWLCGKGKPPYGDKYTLAPEGTWFFRDDGGEITGGFMHTLVMWNTELSEGEVRQECALSCTLRAAPASISSPSVPRT
jgi:hypothetical protein